MKNKKQESILLISFLIIVFIVSVFFNYRFLDIGYLSFRSIDEYAFHGSLLNMYDGVRSADIFKLFSFKFYSYGFVFFFINMLAAFPALATDNTELAIFIPRMVTSIFAIVSLVYVYKICRSYTDYFTSLLILIFTVLIPAFLWNAAWFHPDWMMTCFLLISVYYLTKDSHRYSKDYWVSLFAFGIAIGVKVQAIVFMPFLLSYICYAEAARFDFSTSKVNLLIIVKSILFLVLVFIICNPYIIHPKGFLAFKNFFAENMQSNATNHGTNVDLSFSDKLNNVIEGYYFNYLFFFLFVASLLFFTLRYFKSKTYSVFYSVAIFGLVNLIYLLWMVNKDWQHYYLPVIIISLLVIIPAIARLSDRLKWIMLLSMIIIQGVYYVEDYSKIIYASFNSSRILNLDKVKSTGNYIAGVLRPEITPGTNVLISPYTGLDILKMGLGYNGVHIIWGELSMEMIDKEEFLKKSASKDPARFKVKDFIVLRKDDIYFDTEAARRLSHKNKYKEACRLIKDFYQNKSGYGLFAENEDVVIFKRN